LAEIFKVLGRAENSMGLEECVLMSLEVSELLLCKGPLMTADYFTKVKSTSKSWGPLFLKGILNF
jgi:hypothetical protein